MGWFSKKPPPAPPPKEESPGLDVRPLPPGEVLGALFGPECPAAETAIASALHRLATGKPVSGISGLRVLHRGERLLVLRIGPPPGARWTLRHVRALAVFQGKLAVRDGEEPVVVAAGSLAVAARPSAALLLEAGNDSVLALAIADAPFTARLA